MTRPSIPDLADAIAGGVVKSRPILFSAPMVRAILTGKKTQTRRLIPSAKTDALTRLAKELGKPTTTDEWGVCFDLDGVGGTCSVPLPCKYGQRSDRLWVRETWSHDAPDLNTCRAAYEDASGGFGYGPYYRATEVAPDALRWHPAIHMPRWASRIELEVTAVRVERLQAITEDDARAEGVEPFVHPSGSRCYRDGFARLWDEINGDRVPFDENPWVWVITFTRADT